MHDRRSFLKHATASALALTALPAALRGQNTERADSSSNLPSNGPGEIPDTLDLAQHAAMGLNGALGSMDPRADYEISFLNILDVHPAYMLHWSTMIGGVQTKYVSSLPMLRLASGSKQDQDIEDGFIQSMVKNMEEDGLVYDRAIPSRPWNVGVYYGKKDWNEDYANMAGNGRMICGFLHWYQLTGDEQWMARARKTAERMLELAIVEGDNAWYPNPGLGNDFSYPRKSGWTTKKPPESANEGFEGGAMFYHLTPLRGWALYYQNTGDKRFAELMRKFANVGLQTKFWGGAGEMEPRASAERGHFRLHFHASTSAIRGVLDYGLTCGDQRAQEWAQNAYHYGRQMGIHQLGLFPTSGGGTEGCSIADMIGLAVSLSDAGLGDYWDDVDMYARNGLVCAQATDLNELKRVSAEGKERPANAPWGGHFDSRFKGDNKGNLPGQEISDRILERSIGAFGHLVGARYQTPMMMHCCTANCTQAIYYAWEGIVRREIDTALVNLWLNRRSPWVDIESYLPYAGHLVVRNKGMRRIAIRKPAWIRAGSIRATVNGKEADPAWNGNRMVFQDLSGHEVIELQAPIARLSTEATIVNLSDPQHSSERYAIERKGGTVLSAKLLEQPTKQDKYYKGEQNLNWYRIFQRDALSGDTAPMKPSPSYVHPAKVIRWNVS